jgi:hypothetical protein
LLSLFLLVLLDLVRDFDLKQLAVDIGMFFLDLSSRLLLSSADF